MAEIRKGERKKEEMNDNFIFHYLFIFCTISLVMKM